LSTLPQDGGGVGLDVAGDAVVHAGAGSREFGRRAAVAADKVALFIAKIETTRGLGAQFAPTRNGPREVVVVPRPDPGTWRVPC
jgi:hypothetical protein